MYYVISLNGNKAVDRAKRFIGKHCYKSLYNGNHKLAQVEVVVDEKGTYNGTPNKWVDASYVKYEDIETTIETLAQIFKGCPAMLLEAETDDFIEYSKALCCFKI